MYGSHLLSRSKALSGYLTSTAPASTMALLNIWVSTMCARKSKLSAESNGSPAPTAGAHVQSTTAAVLLVMITHMQSIST